jgi:hypothetical protein
MRRPAFVFTLLVVCAGCGGDSGSGAPALRCEDGTPTIGVAGDVTSEVLPLTWDADGVATVDLLVPDDLTALSLVAEDGAEYTAFLGVRQDSRTFINLRRDPDGRRGPFFHTWSVE